MKRIGLYLLVNLLVLTTIVIVTTALGVNNYMTSSGLDYFSLLIFAAVVGFSGSFISLLMSKWMAKYCVGRPSSFKNGTIVVLTQ